MQAAPQLIVILALGLCGNEASSYAQDLITWLPKEFIIITVCGLESCDGNSSTEKFFLKNDCSRVVGAILLAKKINIKAPIVGVGVSLGGALLLQAHDKTKNMLRGIVLISTSIWYEHALNTMGWLASWILTWWQFKRLFFTPNFLHGKMSFMNWLSLLFASSMLEQDILMCRKYNMDYDEYIQSLDLRAMIRENINVFYLASVHDPLFSEEHMEETKRALKYTNVKTCIVEDFGSHGEFSKSERNDFLVEYVIGCLRELFIT
jgi:alpha-beta hydrolase superfamily lysophospholipase